MVAAVKKWHLIAAAAVLLFIGAAVAVSLSRKDSGMLKTDRCPTIAWPRAKLPLFVIVSDPEISEATEKAVAFWDAAHSGLFLFHGEMAPTDVAESTGTIIAVVHVAADDSDWDERRAHAKPTFSDNCEMLRVAIDVPDSIPAEMRYRVIAHELGHALGLADDEAPEHSVMYRRALAEDFELTPGDAALLREAYEEIDAGP